MERYGFSSHDLALMCSSHSGEAMHVGIVQRMLAGAGADASRCSAAAMRRRFSPRPKPRRPA